MIDRLLSINFCWRVTRRANSRQFLFHQTKRAIAQCSMFDVRCSMPNVHRSLPNVDDAIGRLFEKKTPPGDVLSGIKP